MPHTQEQTFGNITSSSFSRAKLAVGKQLKAWKEYPHARAKLRAMPPGPPIFVTGAHRTGTTWVAAMLNASQGLWYLHEPFAPYKCLWPEWFTYADPERKHPDIDKLVSACLNGGARSALNLPWSEHPLMPLRLLPQPINRVLIKDPIACLASDYMTRRFGLTTLVLFRHPAAFVESLTRLGWPSGRFIKQFLEDNALMNDWLEPYRELLEYSSDKDSLSSRTVLYGALNKVLFGYLEQNENMILLRYEDLCYEPEKEFDRLFKLLALPVDTSSRKRQVELCQDSDSDYRAHAITRDPKSTANAWKKHLWQRDVNEIRRIWEQFEIDLYQDKSEWYLN